MNRQYNDQGEKWTSLYVRLSRDDENEGDSNSIAHQIEILTKYAKDHGITNYKVYKNDGYSGTSFKRPSFQEMLADIEAGLVSTVVVKDMSRFGRNYLEVGLYTEIRFPEMGVRFIAVNDGVDSDDQMGNDFAPFRNIINEWYAKDTSKKIRAVFRNKGMSGQRLFTNAPYGYIKGENGHLLVDEETAPVVELIFRLCAEGNGPGKIARMLKERGIPTPGTIGFQRTGWTRNYHPDDPCAWSEGSIANILEQDAYLGRTTNFKTGKLSYKSKKTLRIRRTSGRYLKIPTRPSSTRKPGGSCKRRGSSAAALPRWEKWGCSPGWPTAPTAERDCITAGRLPGRMNRSATPAPPIGAKKAAAPIISGRWRWNSLCFKICRGW